MRSVRLNGKFLSAPPTGVHRVARELIGALDRRLGGPGGDLDEWIVLKPKDAHGELDLSHIEVKTVGLTTWQLWEQLDLPLAARNCVLVNLCNLGPITHHRSLTMIHDAQVFSTPQSYGKGFRAAYRTLLPMIGRASMQVLTVSEYSKQQLIAYGVAEADKITVIPNGGDHISRVVTDFDGLDALTLESRPFFVALANTQTHKNIVVLLRAFASPKLAASRLVLVGSSTRRDFIDRGFTVSGNVIFAGTLTDGVFKAMLMRARALLFPSLTEGFGLPPLEAMVLGRPVIVAPRGAIPEVCGDAAVYVDPDDPAGWIEAAARMADDDDWSKSLGEEGRRRASAFRWDASAQALRSVIARFQ